jgi:hypothetical protein
MILLLLFQLLLRLPLPLPLLLEKKDRGNVVDAELTRVVATAVDRGTLVHRRRTVLREAPTMAVLAIIMVVFCWTLIVPSDDRCRFGRRRFVFCSL